MANNKYNRKTSEEKLKEIKDLSTKAYEQITKYTHSEKDLKEYADFMAKFYHYSPRNNSLIQNQFPGANAVASFKDWKDAGYYINKGEKGIKVLSYTPITKFKTDSGDEKTLRYATRVEKQKIKDGIIKTRKIPAYSVGHVYDVSQTNAPVEDLPKIFPNRQFNFEIEDGNNAKHLQKGINALAKEMNIEIKDMKESKLGLYELGSSKGAFVQSLDGRKEVVMNSRNTETQHLATSIHELSHASIHSMDKEGSNYNKATQEFQAELTSYIVCKHYGMDTSEKAIPYMAAWTKRGDKIEDKQKAMEEVHKVSQKFINTMDFVINQERNLNMSNLSLDEEYPKDQHENSYKKYADSIHSDKEERYKQDIESASNATLPQAKENMERFFENNGIGETDGSRIKKLFQEVDQASFNPKQMKQKVVQELDNTFPAIMRNTALKQKVIQEVDEAFNASPSQLKQNETNGVDKAKETTSYSNNTNYNENKKRHKMKKMNLER